MRIKPLFYLAVFTLLGDLSSRAQSDPLSSWTPRNLTLTNNGLNAIVYGNNEFVAVGTSGAVLTSPDGSTWTAQTTGAHGDLTGVAYGNTLFAAVGMDGSILTSPDGVMWTERLSSSNLLLAVTYGNGQFVAVGENNMFGGAILTSPDGIAWTSRVSASDVRLSSVAYGKNLFVATGGKSNSGEIVTSSNGIDWSLATVLPSDNSFVGAVYGNGLFLAGLSPGPGFLTSSNGTDWVFDSLQSVVPLGGGIDNANAFGDGYFAVVGHGLIATTPDGLAWSNRLAGPIASMDPDLLGIVFGNGTFVAVGVAGTVLQSGVLQEQPVLGPLVILPGGGSQITLTGQAGVTYPVQISTDLLRWTSLTNFALTGSSGSFIDLSASGSARRFYRVSSQP